MTEKLSLGAKRVESPGSCLGKANDTMVDTRDGFVLALNLRDTH